MTPNDSTPAADNDRTTKTKKQHPRLASARAWWNEAWAQGGFLHERWEDIRNAPDAGWHGMANWLKVALAAAGASVLVLLLNGAAEAIAYAIHHLLTAMPNVQIGTDTSTGVWAVIDNPVRSYIATHSVDLPISASTVYTLWQAVGLLSLIAGLLTRNNGVRLTWTAWGAASIAMVWTPPRPRAPSPPPSQSSSGQSPPPSPYADSTCARSSSPPSTPTPRRSPSSLKSTSLTKPTKSRTSGSRSKATGLPRAERVRGSGNTSKPRDTTPELELSPTEPTKRQPGDGRAAAAHLTAHAHPCVRSRRTR